MRVPQKHTVRTSLTPRQKEQARLDEMLQKKSTASKPTSPRTVTLQTVTPRTVAPKVTPKIPLLNITNRVKAPSNPSAITPKLTQKKAVRKTAQRTSPQTQTLEVRPQIQTTLSPVNALVEKEKKLKELVLLQSSVKNKIEETIEEIWELERTIPSDHEFQVDDTPTYFESPVLENTPIADFKNFIRDLEDATTFEQFEITSVPVLLSAEANEFRAFAETLEEGFEKMKQTLVVSPSSQEANAFRAFVENLENGFQQIKESLSLVSSPFSDEVSLFSFPDSAPSSPRSDEPISSSLSTTETPSSEANGGSSSECPAVSLITL